MSVAASSTRPSCYGGYMSTTAMAQHSPSCLSRKNLKYMHSAYPNLATEEHRRKDLREVVPVIPADCFFGNGLLPDLRPGINVNKIVAKLVKKKVVYPSNGGRWAKFNSSRQLLQHEDEVLAVWPRIIDEIIEASGVDRSEATLTFECNPSGIIHWYSRNNHSRPDCVGRLSSASGDFYERQWTDVAVPGEFKKANTLDGLRDDTTKVIRSMRHIMREDPRRRFVFGFTIEQCQMRLWLVSRSDVLVSFAIDVHKHHRRVIEFFLRVIFAKPYQLGWDDTLRRLPSDPYTPPRYEIDVNGKTYRTVRLLSNVGAEALRGRGTRVWEVRELSQNGEELDMPLVLKDSWVDSDCTREGEVLKNIRSASNINVKLAVLVDITLLHTHDYGDVQVCGEDDDAHTVIRRGLDLSKYKQISDFKARERVVTPTGIAPPPKSRQADLLQYGAKVHHRVVFKEVGIRITEVESLAQVFVRLGEVVAGLAMMHMCGWVHRDISIGNILVANGAGILADVEYAKSESATTQHSMRTGTFPFMAVEVEEGQYLYPTMEPLPILTTDALNVADIMEIGEQLFPTQEVTPPTIGPSDTAHPSKSAIPPEIDWSSIVTPPFIYNPLHDLESIFWVSLWAIVCSEFVKDDPTMTQEQWDAYLVAHREYAADLFGDSKFRRNIMTATSNDFLAPARRFLPRIRNIMVILDVFRRILITRYREVEERLGAPDYKIKFSVAAMGLHKQIIKLFGQISGMLTSTADLRVVVKEQDALPTKPVTAATGPANTAGTATPGRSSSDAGGEPPSPARPAPSTRTPPHRFPAPASAPAVLPDSKQAAVVDSSPNMSTAPSGLRRVVVEENATLPVKHKVRNTVAAGTAHTAAAAAARSSSAAGGAPSSRPAKSLKTPLSRFAALASAPAFPPDSKRRTRSQSGSLPKRGGARRSGRR